MFIAFSFEPLAILASVCFHEHFNASTEGGAHEQDPFDEPSDADAVRHRCRG